MSKHHQELLESEKHNPGIVNTGFMNHGLSSSNLGEIKALRVAGTSEHLPAITLADTTKTPSSGQLSGQEWTIGGPNCKTDAKYHKGKLVISATGCEIRVSPSEESQGLGKVDY